MSVETSKNAPEILESWFGNYEAEYEIACYMATLRLMKGIASSAVIKPPKDGDKTVAAFIYKLCSQTYKDHSQLVPRLQKWVQALPTNDQQELAMSTLGLLVRPEYEPKNLMLNPSFELAVSLEYSEDKICEDMRLTSDIERHNPNIDHYVTYYLEDIENETLRGFSVVNALEDALRNIGFYIGHEDPRFREPGTRVVPYL